MGVDVHGVGNMPARVLVVEPAVDDVIPLDLVRIPTGDNLVELQYVSDVETMYAARLTVSAEMRTRPSSPRTWWQGKILPTISSPKPGMAFRSPNGLAIRPFAQGLTAPPWPVTAMLARAALQPGLPSKLGMCCAVGRRP